METATVPANRPASSSIISTRDSNHRQLPSRRRIRKVMSSGAARLMWRLIARMKLACSLGWTRSWARMPSSSSRRYPSTSSCASLTKRKRPATPARANTSGRAASARSKCSVAARMRSAARVAASTARQQHDHRGSPVPLHGPHRFDHELAAVGPLEVILVAVGAVPSGRGPRAGGRGGVPCRGCAPRLACRQAPPVAGQPCRRTRRWRGRSSHRGGHRRRRAKAPRGTGNGAEAIRRRSV